MFRELFVRENFDFDFKYDWILKKQALKQRLAASTRQNQRVEEEKKENPHVQSRTNITSNNNRMGADPAATTGFPALPMPKDDLNESKVNVGAATKTGRESSQTAHMTKVGGFNGVNNLSTMNILGGVTPNESVFI